MHDRQQRRRPPRIGKAPAAPVGPRFPIDLLGARARSARFSSAPSPASAWSPPATCASVETTGIGNVPAGRVLLISNHAGQVAIDGVMIATACLLEAEPPRLPRAMGEYWLPTLPFVNVLMVRTGSVVGTPRNCVDLLERGEAVLAFPEGVRGMNKSFTERYRLMRFGHGFMRLALQTDTPIVPIAVVGSEEQMPSLGDFRPLARLLGMPAFPLVLTPLPLPVRYHVRFGEPMRFTGSHADEDAIVGEKVRQVKSRIRAMLDEGLRARRGIFA